MSRRDQISMSPEELSDYLKTSRTIILVSNGKNGYPHPAPMWYAVSDNNTVYMTTFRKSQKAINIERDRRVALLVESGDRYEDLKAVLIYAEAELVEDIDAVANILYKISQQRGDVSQAKKEDAVKTVGKRIGLKFVPKKIVSWDHAKLNGFY